LNDVITPWARHRPNRPASGRGFKVRALGFDVAEMDASISSNITALRWTAGVTLVLGLGEHRNEKQKRRDKPVWRKG